MILVFVIKLNYITLLSLLFFRTRRLRTPSNKLIVNLTVADFMLLFMCHFVSLQNVLGPMLGIWFGAIGKIIYPKYDKNSNKNCTIDVLEQIVEIKGPESWWIAKSITISRVVNQSKVNPQRPKGVVD